MLFQAEPAIKLSSQPKLALEMVFLKLFQSAPALPIQTLIERLDQLQKNIGEMPPAVAEAPGPPHSPPVTDRDPAYDPAVPDDDIPPLKENNVPAPDMENSGRPSDAPAADTVVLWKRVMDRHGSLRG